MPKVNEHCNLCGACVDICPCGAVEIKDGKVVIDADNCLDCGACVDECPQQAMESNNS